MKRRAAWAAGLFALFALALRWHALGDPLAGLDEQFYLLVGDRIAHAGALPYLDIWDRKPAGLFLLYALFRLLPGDGILTYQMAGLAALTVTAWLAYRIARPALSFAAAIAAGLAVVLFGILLGVGFGEAPIFYDPLVAAAVLLVLRSRRDGSVRSGAAAMLLCGVALTLKTSAVFESCALGLLLLQADRGRGWQAVIGRGLLYLALGLLPTAALGIFYWRIGAFDLFWFANFRSIFLKTGGGDDWGALIACVVMLLPLIVPAIFGARHVAPAMRPVLGAWLAATALGFVAIGFFHLHYALPLVTPLAIVAAHALRSRAMAVLASIALAVPGMLAVVDGDDGARRDRAEVAALARLLPAAVRTRCLFVYEGPSIVYHLSQACLPGRYVFPGHFTDPGEAAALGEPADVVLGDVLARQPAAIVSVPGLHVGSAITRNDRLLAETLQQSYRPIGGGWIRLYGARRVRAVVWVPQR